LTRCLKRSQGFLTLFAFLLAGAYINPAATAIEFLAGNIKPRRFLALRACPAVACCSATRPLRPARRGVHPRRPRAAAALAARAAPSVA
jgi:hypothetical protein